LLVLWRMDLLAAEHDGSLHRPLSAWMRRLPMMVVLQGLWLLSLLACFWLWYRGVAWAAATHIISASEPDLVGYLCWLIFLSLGFFVLWAMVSWVLAIAPVLLVHEDSGWTALGNSFRLGKAFSSKLVEVNLVMAIVKIALIVLAMVFSAAPLPFSDQFGPEFMHVLYVAIIIGFLVGNDYFQVVRLRSFVAFWRHYSGDEKLPLATFEPDGRIKKYSALQKEFAAEILEIEEILFVSDVSSLWDFTHETTLEPYYAKIRAKYGMDVSDIDGALLWRIFQRIAERDRI